MGKKLFSLGISNIPKKGFIRSGITFSSYTDADNLLVYEVFMKEDYKIYIPQTFLTIKGIVKNVGHSTIEEDFLNEAYCRYVPPIFYILEARRLNRRVVFTKMEKLVSYPQ